MVVPLLLELVRLPLLVLPLIKDLVLWLKFVLQDAEVAPFLCTVDDDAGCLHPLVAFIFLVALHVLLQYTHDDLKLLLADAAGIETGAGADDDTMPPSFLAE